MLNTKVYENGWFILKEGDYSFFRMFGGGHIKYDPEKHIWISRILPYGYMVEDLDQELFLLDDPIPKGVLLLRRCIKRYQYLHIILEQMIDKLISDCSSYEECILTLRQNKNKEQLQPTITEMENQRKKTVEVVDSLRVLLD